MGATTECALAYFGLFSLVGGCTRLTSQSVSLSLSRDPVITNPPARIRPRSSTVIWVMVTGENEEVGFCGFVLCVFVSMFVFVCVHSIQVADEG